MEYNWIPIAGNFIKNGETIVFKGSTVEYNDSDGKGKVPGASIGNLIFNKQFNGGTITAEIEFTNSENVSCGIMPYYSTNPYSRNIVEAGITSSYVMFEIKEFDESRWNLLSATGDPVNLKAGTKYLIQVILHGSKIILKIDGIEVLTSILTKPLSSSNVGIWCQSYNDIIIHDFKVETELPKAFVIMQFASPYNEVYYEVIRKVCAESGITVIRGDETFTTGLIISEITTLINESTLIIADITPNNPNVYYEVGYSHALRKPTILLAENPEKLPFDVSPFRVLFYENSIRGKTKLEEGLRKHINEILFK